MGAKDSRAPRGARGLKHQTHYRKFGFLKSRPARGAWIETVSSESNHAEVKSRPARGAWIETEWRKEHPLQRRVAPRAGRVD